MRAKIIAVDFDGTLIEEGKWPGIGATNEKVLNYCKDEQAKGARIILWTNRIDKPLETAIKWCEEHGLRLDAVNDNVPESVEFFGTNTRKIYADEFIDDRMAILGFEQSTLMVELSCSKNITWPADILTSTTALSADDGLARRLIPNRFLSRKFLRICITLMAGLWP